VSEPGLAAALRACALADRSGLARLRADGPDFLDLLHRLSTGDVARLPVGQGAATVLTTPKGRIVDRLFVHRVRDEQTLAVGSAGREAALLAHLVRFTFAERTGLADLTGETVQLALIGPGAREAASSAGLPAPSPLAVAETVFAGASVTVVGEDGSSSDGLSLIAAVGDAPRLRAALLPLGPELTPAALEAWRILRGFPGPAEMDDERNPLEAGLWDAVSFTKGYYVGQEVVARLRTYDKVVRARVTLSLPAGAEVPPRGAALLEGERAVGTVTSAVLPPGDRSPVCMGYVRREFAVAGARVRVGWDGASAEGTVRSASSSRAA
jgi:folate-binding protein YgfZ